MLNAFRNFQLDRLNLDEMVELVAVGENLRSTYEKLGLDEPEWVNTQLKALKASIRLNVAEKAAARRKEIEARLDSLKTPTEKKRELQAELKKLDAMEVA